VAEQLHVLPEVIAAYGSRIATRTTHLQQVQRHLGFRRATPLDVYALQTWLLERALEHDKPTLGDFQKSSYYDRVGMLR
jgi:hypothetical protein